LNPLPSGAGQRRPEFALLVDAPGFINEDVAGFGIAGEERTCGDPSTDPRPVRVENADETARLDILGCEVPSGGDRGIVGFLAEQGLCPAQLTA
jgi:hypothetical protein